MELSAVSDEDLVHRCALSRDGAVWEEFVRRFDRVLQSAVYRAIRGYAKVDHSTVDDLVQEVYSKLCGVKQSSLADFHAEHSESAKSFLRVITTNLVFDYFRTIHRERRDSRLTISLSDESQKAEQAAASGSPELVVAIAEIDDFLISSPRETAQRDRQIFWLYYLSELTAREIAAIPAMQLALKGVQSSIQRTTQEVRKRFKPKASERSTKLDVSNEGFRTAESL